MTELNLNAIAKAYGKYCLDLPASTPLTVVRVFQQVPHLIDEVRRLEAQIEELEAKIEQFEQLRILEQNALSDAVRQIAELEAALIELKVATNDNQG